MVMSPIGFLVVGTGATAVGLTTTLVIVLGCHLVVRVAASLQRDTWQVRPTLAAGSSLYQAG
jgi:hypothetical protein